MADLEEMKLQRMGLVELPDDEHDAAIGEEDFNTRKDLYEDLKTSFLTEDKAFVGSKTAYETTEYAGDGQIVPCYLPIPILKIHGAIPNKLSKSKTDKYIYPGRALIKRDQNGNRIQSGTDKCI